MERLPDSRREATNLDLATTPFPLVALVVASSFVAPLKPAHPGRRAAEKLPARRTEFHLTTNMTVSKDKAH